MEKYLTKLKRQYQEVKPTPYLQQNGWIEMYQKLQDREVSTAWGRIARLSLAMFSAMFFIGATFGLIKVANAAAPETTFYPVKLAIEVVVEKVTGSNQLALEHRAEEITNLAEKDENPELLKEVVGEYVKSVDEEKKEIEEEGDEEDRKDLEKKLELHKKEFNQAIKENPSAKDEVEEAINATENNENAGNNEGKGNVPEVKGKSEETHGNNESRENKGKSEEKGKGKD